MSVAPPGRFETGRTRMGKGRVGHPRSEPTGPDGADHTGVEGRRRSSATFDLTAELLISALLVFTPLAYGASEAWSREVFLVGFGAAALIVALKHTVRACTGRPSGYTWSWAYPVMVAFLGLSALQAVPLPTAWVTAISPGTVSLRSELLADVPGAGGLAHRTIVSFYPRATVEQAVLTLAIAALFVVVLDVYRDAARVRRLLLVIVGVGLVMAAIAGYEAVTGSTAFNGGVPNAHRVAATLANYSRFSQYMNLSVGAALAFLLDRLADLSRDHRSPGDLWAALRRRQHAAVWACAALCVVGPLTVILSSSRMGVISTVVAAVVTGGMLVLRTRTLPAGPIGRGSAIAWLPVGLGLAVFTALLAVGYFDAATSRMDTVRDLDAAGGSRQAMWRNMTQEFRQFPWVGTGLGTHKFVFGLYDRLAIPLIASHAENEYLQLMEETGLCGVALASAFLVGLAVVYARATRQPDRPGGLVPFGLGFGLVAILIHSNSDFGQHSPANAELTAAFAALLTLSGRRRPATTTPATPPPDNAPDHRRPRVAHAAAVAGQWAVVVAVAISAALVWRWADRARRAASLAAAADQSAERLASADWRGDRAAFDGLMTPADAAVAVTPDDVERRYWADVYRIYSVTRAAGPTTAAAVTPAGRATAERVVKDLDAIRVICPTFGLPVDLSAQINRDLLDRTDLAARQSWLAYRLAPFNRDVCLRAGIDALAHRRGGDAWDALSHFAALGGSPRQYADACVRANRPIIAYWIARDDRRALAEVSGRMSDPDPAWLAWVDFSRRRADRLLVAEADEPDAAPGTVAEQADADVRRGDRPAAIDRYRRALAVDYVNVDWRMRLAAVLADAGRYAEAARELKVCLNLQPANAAARSLFDAYERKARSAAAADRPSSRP